MNFWKYNVGDKILLNSGHQYIVVDRYVDGQYKKLPFPEITDVQKMYVLMARANSKVYFAEETGIDKMIKEYKGKVSSIDTSSINVTVTNVDKKSNAVDHPSYYQGKIEVIDFIEDKKLGFNLGNCVKYISRAGKKNPDKRIEDLKKARWYLDREINKEE